MGLISRPAKEGGFFSYVEKVANGFTKILAAEADADSDTIYAEFNGHITNANIDDAAGIARSKLTLTGGIDTADLADGAVTTAKLDDAAVTPAKVATLASEFGAATPGMAFGQAAGEQTMGTATVTTQGGPVYLLASIGASWAAFNGGGSLLWKWKRDATIIGPHSQAINAPSGLSIQVQVTAPSMVDAPPAGTYTYTLTLTVSGSSISISTPGAFPGGIFVTERL